MSAAIIQLGMSVLVVVVALIAYNRYVAGTKIAQRANG